VNSGLWCGRDVFSFGRARHEAAGEDPRRLFKELARLLSDVLTAVLVNSWYGLRSSLSYS
jgi:hypothetical protein